MRAVRIHETGGPEVLRVDQIDVPVPGPDEVLIRVGAAGVNFTDVTARQGVYISRDSAPVLPATLGTEVAGVVSATGPGVPQELVGRRVVAFVHGGYADYALARRDLTAELPPGVDLAESTALPVQGVTAWQLLRDCARIAPGESVLVHTAAGGVGSLAVQLARRFGAGTVIATAGSAEKRKLALDLGADFAFDYTSEQWPRDVLDATGGRGVDIILDAVGGPVGEAGPGCLAPFGRLVVYGVTGKQLAQFAGSQLMRGNQSVIGYWLTGRLPAGPDAAAGHPIAGILRELVELTASGGLRPVLREAFPLERAADAHRAISDRRTVGKVVLTL
ncbi:MAG: NADPH:quinone oxidoreductase family protein [Catenulispora sp.]|nr:NADPH:quinone oxidoreductase family protein [Catenulispora sp.]